MGLGKTLQTLAVLVAVQEQLGFTTKTTNFDLFQNETTIERQPLKALIVLPSSLVFNWYNEAAKFTPHFSKMQYVGNDRKLLANRLHFRKVRSEEHTSELQSQLTISYAVFCLKKNFFNDTATTEIYTLSLHDALPISLF